MYASEGTSFAGHHPRAPASSLPTLSGGLHPRTTTTPPRAVVLPVALDYFTPHDHITSGLSVRRRLPGFIVIGEDEFRDSCHDAKN